MRRVTLRAWVTTDTQILDDVGNTGAAGVVS